MALRCLASACQKQGSRRLLKGARVEEGLMGSALSSGGRRGHRGGAREQSQPGGGSNVGVVLAAFMEQQGLTQAQLADRLGVDRTYVSKVLWGSRQISDVGRLR